MSQIQRLNMTMNKIKATNMFRFALLVLLIASATALVPLARISVRSSSLKMSIFDDAVNEFKATYPAAYDKGWGPTTKAERWNGRHAMFGWVALIATGYAKGHNLIPNADALLDMKDWGSLAYIYGGSITNERAVILVGHLHLLFVSICATVAPLSFQEKIYLEDGEEHEAMAGLIPKYNKPGLTREAELVNGRLAMLGLVVLIIQATIYQTPILDVINSGVGGLLF